jgi:hypothetical protein
MEMIRCKKRLEEQKANRSPPLSPQANSSLPRLSEPGAAIVTGQSSLAYGPLLDRRSGLTWLEAWATASFGVQLRTRILAATRKSNDTQGETKVQC